MSGGEQVKTALVVDDSREYRVELVKRVKRTLRGWRVKSAGSKKKAQTLIEGFSKNGGTILGIAVVDLYLQDPPERQGEGLDVLRAVQAASPDCYRILVSRRVSTPPLTESDPQIDRFISLRLKDTSPLAELKSALLEAKRRFE